MPIMPKPIMGYNEWMRRTKLSFKPRIASLKLLDAAVKAYGKHRGSSAHLETLHAAFLAWAKSEEKLLDRNHNGAVTDLMNQLRQQIYQPAAHLRPYGHLEEIRRGAQLHSIEEGVQFLGQGERKPQIRVALQIGEEDRTKGNVVYEDFDPDDLLRAQKAWSCAYDFADLAAQGASRIYNNDTQISDKKEAERFQRWFGTPTLGRVRTMIENLQKMNMAFRQTRVVIVNRPDITKVCAVKVDDPFGEMIPHSIRLVNAYVFPHKAGSGYRVIMVRQFLDKSDPIEDAAHCIYHELTHKVLDTMDHGYGTAECCRFAARAQPISMRNADNYAFYAVSFIKDIEMDEVPLWMTMDM